MSSLSIFLQILYPRYSQTRINYITNRLITIKLKYKLVEPVSNEHFKNCNHIYINLNHPRNSTALVYQNLTYFLLSNIVLFYTKQFYSP
jgi:hypothetical protein